MKSRHRGWQSRWCGNTLLVVGVAIIVMAIAYGSGRSFGTRTRGAGIAPDSVVSLVRDTPEPAPTAASHQANVPMPTIASADVEVRQERRTARLSDESLPVLRDQSPVLQGASRGLIADASPSPDVGPAYAEPVRTAPPTHISVPAVGIDSDIVEVIAHAGEIDGQPVFIWPATDWAVGHHATSARPGDGGNIVLAGHDDVRGEVFHGLHDIQQGDLIYVTSASGQFTYVVQEIYLREYQQATIDDQIAVGVFIGPMPEERLTLTTCWPYGVDTHRLIVVAKPAGDDTSD